MPRGTVFTIPGATCNCQHSNRHSNSDHRHSTALPDLNLPWPVEPCPSRTHPPDTGQACVCQFFVPTDSSYFSTGNLCMVLGPVFAHEPREPFAADSNKLINLMTKALHLQSISTLRQHLCSCLAVEFCACVQPTGDGKRVRYTEIIICG